MKNEQSIFVLVALSLLALAIFTSYHTPQVMDRGSETDYLIDIENYKREVADRISIDNGRMTELNERFEIKKSVSGKDEDELGMLKENINGMQATMNNYEGNGLEDWEFFKDKFENDLTELHESLINLIIKTSYSLNNNNSIQSFAKP